MLIFGTFGIVELWAHREPYLLWAGAWLPGDIERAFPEAIVEDVDPATHERRWRRFRAAVHRSAAEIVIADAAKAIRYDGLYSQLPSIRHRQLLEEWRSGASDIAEWEWWRHHRKRPPPE